MSLVLESFQSSDLNRNPVKVFAAAEQAPVLVTRRDGQDLILMTEQEVEAQREFFNLAADLFAVTSATEGTLGQRMANRFPWMFALDAVGREECAMELVNSARASFATGQPNLLRLSFLGWKDTAYAIAGGRTEHNTSDWFDFPIPVESPE
jgi:hypothetical protein